MLVFSTGTVTVFLEIVWCWVLRRGEGGGLRGERGGGGGGE